MVCPFVIPALNGFRVWSQFSGSLQWDSGSGRHSPDLYSETPGLVAIHQVRWVGLRVWSQFTRSVESDSGSGRCLPGHQSPGKDRFRVWSSVRLPDSSNR